MARYTKAMILKDLEDARSIIDEQAGVISLLQKELCVHKQYGVSGHMATMMISVQRLAESASNIAEAATRVR